MGIEETGRGRAAPRRRRGAGAAPARRIKASITLSDEAYDRLLIHAAKARTTHSALVERLILDHLRRWVVSDRGGGEEPAGPAPVPDPRAVG